MKSAYARLKLLLRLLGLLGAALWLWPVPSAVLQGVSIEELARGADAVVRGEVVRVDTRLVDEGRMLLTQLEVLVREDYSGAGLDSVHVLLPGGAKGELIQRVAGMPSFSRGEEVVLFLELHPGPPCPSSPARYTLSSMGLGAFVIDGPLARRQTDGLEIVTGPLHSPSPVPLEERVIPLGCLEKRIHSAINGGAP